MKLFHFKLRRESASSLLSFCARNTLKLQRVDGEELAEIRAQLIACQASGEDLEHHFKVPFTFVLDLVASRSVFLHLGYAFVPASAVGSILKHRLESVITEGRPLAKVAFSKMKNDARFTHIINHVSSAIRKVTECSSNVELPPTIALNMAALPHIAEKSFPWCMLQYHHKVSSKLRIDHPGWLQYSSFLKDVGANVGEVMEYWREYYLALGRTNSDIRKIDYDVKTSIWFRGS